MFNGIIKKIGKIKFIKKENNNLIIGISVNYHFKKSDIGSSVSCNGVCLTITNIKKRTIFFYISKETLKKSNFRFIKLNDFINIEKSITYGQKISGHFVQGHVDTTAVIKKIIILGGSWIVKFYINDKKLTKYLIAKASISINGVSLTISNVKNSFFEISIIPHTLKLTNLKNLEINNIVNVELDIFAKYILKISK